MLFTSSVFASFTALLCTSFGFADARVVQRDVVSPPITYPTAGTVWNVNERHNVTWDTSVIPPGTNNTGMIVLGFLDPSDPFNEHLDLNNPLAKGFPITAGSADITVPSVTTRDSYILVLFGDSGNASPKFSINNISITTTSSSTVASSLASSSSTPGSTTDVPQIGSPAGSSPTSTLEAVSLTDNRSISGSIATASAHVSSIFSSVASSSVFVASSAASSTPAAQGTQAAAQSTTSPNAGVRSASYGGAATWISSICSLALVLGFSL